jgi:DNA helicase-2/ATP-dependent DNA helicase PcrA
MSVPGPAALGRGVVVTAGQAVPDPWAGAPVETIDEDTLADPGSTVAALHQAWATRRPIVIALAVDPARFRNPESWSVEPWRCPAAFEPWSDRLHFLVWANTYDGRRPGAAPTWWWGRKAARLAGVDDVGAAGSGDVRLPDGRGAWIDGGPRAPFPSEAVDSLVVVHRESVELGRLTAVPTPAPPVADLAPDQLAAVAHRCGPARIIAPAGSGKTRVLTERLRHLIADRRYERETVLAVAYNKKAHEELEARCAGFRPRVRTLNSLGYSLLGEARGAMPQLLEERDVRRHVERLVPIRRQRANTDPVAPYIEALSRVRLGLVDPEDVEAERDDVPGLAAAFGPYRDALRQAGAVDFDEQIYGAIEALLGDGSFRRRAQAGCQHLLVDEFQDLTPAHVLLLRLLAVPGLDVFGVGDDDQVIYGHAGADPGFLIGFGGLFPAAGDHPLEVNYRCPVPVVEQATALLGHNRRRVSKAIRPGPAARQGPDSIRVVTHGTETGATELVNAVRGWLDDGARPTDIAVLTRVNALLLAPQVALDESGVPVASALRAGVLERTGARAALAYLRIATAPDGGIAASDVVEILRRPSRGLPQWFPDRLRQRRTWSLDGIGRLAGAVPGKEAPKVERLAAELERLVGKARARRATTDGLLRIIRDDMGLGGAMGLLDTSGGGEGSSHLDDLDALEQVAALHPDPATFERWLRARLEAAPSGDGVTLSTVHRVKGMEWDRVAVFGVCGGLMPHRLADDEEEERRVLHVAITRCRREVVILTDRHRPSPFLAELRGEAPVAVGAPSAPSRPGGSVGPGSPSAGSGRRRSTTADPVSTPAVDPSIEQALRAWRTGRSRQDRVSPFIVLHDRTLLAVAAARPTSLVALRQVAGIGPTKLELYGEEILATLAAMSASAGGGG